MYFKFFILILISCLYLYGITADEHGDLRKVTGYVYIIVITYMIAVPKKAGKLCILAPPPPNLGEGAKRNQLVSFSPQAENKKINFSSFLLINLLLKRKFKNFFKR
jgi:hypothetical protein